MLENNKQDHYYCSFCGSNLPESFIEKLKNNSGILICEQCGAEITKENFSTHESLIEVEKKVHNDNSILEVKHDTSLEGYSTVERYCLEMRSFMCRRIYDFFNNVKYSIRVYEEKGLDSFQLKVLARDFRKRLKRTHFQVNWINDPISVSFDEYLKFFETFKAHLRYKKVYRTQYLDFIRDSLQLVMGLIVGRNQASSLSGIDREIYNDLKRYLCFIVNDDARDNFKFNLTIFLSWFIYRMAKKPIIYRSFAKSDGTLSEGQVNTLAKVIIKFLKEEPLKKNLINKFRGADKRKFKKNFKKFQHLLKNDQLYCDVVFDYSCWLIRLVLDLIRGKYSSTELSGIKLEVLKHLKWRNLFEKDQSLSIEFKRNILIVLSHVINLNFKDLEKSSGLKASQMMLKESAINALVRELKTIIGGKDEINSNLLGNLKDITLLDFRREYERFQSNLKSDWIYSQSFSLNLYKLISDVFRLISEPPDHSLLNDYEKAIFDDLVSYNFDDFLSEKDGEKREKVNASSKKQEKTPKNQKNEYLRTYRSEWEIYLVESIEKANKEDISSETKKRLIENIKQYRKFWSLYKNLITLLEKVSVTKLEKKEIHELVEKIGKMTPIQVAMFEKLKAFQEFYNENIDWHESRVHGEIKKFMNYLAKKLESFKPFMASDLSPLKSRVLLIDNLRERFNEGMKLDRNADTAEFIGIILGDGNLTYNRNKPEYRLDISLNIVDEKEFVDYVNYYMRLLFNEEPRMRKVIDNRSPTGDSKGVNIQITKKAVVESLMKLGLTPGNKTINQVSVPNWIKQDEQMTKRCIKGLTDTDGCFYVEEKDKSIRFRFLNSSRNLVADFREMCNSIGIKTGAVCGPFSKIDSRTGNESINYSVGIDAKDQIKEFISIVESNKWFIKWNEIGEKLMTLYPNTRNVQEAIDEAFRYKRYLYSKKNAEDLKSLVIEQGGYRLAIEFMRNQNYNLIPPRRTFTSHLKRLFRENEYRIRYGINGYEKWKKYNSNILIDIQNNRFKRFPSNLKKKFCKKILNELKKSGVENVQRNVKDIIASLKYNIDNQDLNGNISQKINSLRYERLSYLWNNANSKPIVEDFFINLTNFVQKIKRYNNTPLTHLHNEFKMLGEQKLIKELREFIKRNDI